MERGVAALTVSSADLFESIEAAGRAGYDVVDIWLDQIGEYLEGKRPIREVAERFTDASVRPGVINPILDIEVPNGPKRKELLARTRRICELASASGVGTLQLVSGTTYAGQPWSMICKETSRGLREIADLAAEYSLAIAFEPIAWWPVRNARQAIEIIGGADRSNVGVLLDSFHIFAPQKARKACRLCFVHFAALRTSGATPYEWLLVDFQTHTMDTPPSGHTFSLQQIITGVLSFNRCHPRPYRFRYRSKSRPLRIVQIGDFLRKPAQVNSPFPVRDVSLTSDDEIEKHLLLIICSYYEILG